MTHSEGEQRVKGLQKAFLCWVEEFPPLRNMSPQGFNELRHRLFKTTFEAFRLGVVGIPTDSEDMLWDRLFGWWEEVVPALPGGRIKELRGRSLQVSLEALRTGAMVASSEE